MDIGRTIKQLYGVFERAFNATLQRFDLTVAQIDILHCLHELAQRDGPVNQRAIEDTLRLKNPTVTGTLNRLEAKGLIARSADPRDGRSNLIELTGMELSIRDELVRMHAEHEAKLTQGFTQAEKQMLEDLLGRALKNMTEDEEKV